MWACSVDTPPVKKDSLSGSFFFLPFQCELSAPTQRFTTKNRAALANGAPAALFFYSSIWISFCGITNEDSANVSCAAYLGTIVVGLPTVQYK